MSLRVFLLMLALSGAAYAETPGRALQSGDSQAAARALAADLTDTLARSGASLYAADANALEADLARELAPVAALAQDRSVAWSADLDVEWRENAAAQRTGRTACGGYVELGEAAVTATSTSRSQVAGIARMLCSVATQAENTFGWTGVSAASAGEGALFIRFTVESRDGAVRQLAAQHLARALERVAAAVRPLNNRRAPPPPPERTT